MEPRPADTYHTIESNLETSGSASASSYQMRHPALSSQIQAILSYPDQGLQLDGQDQQDDSFEAFTNTWFGFVQDSHDAALVMEAVIAKHLQAVNSVPGVSMSSIPIQSGTVLVFSESRAVSNNMQRWRDSKRWSPSRPQGPFLLYREVEPKLLASESTNLELETSTRFVNLSLRGNRRFVLNGLAKRTIGLTGSDGNKYRIINYFYPNDVESIYERENNNSNSSSSASKPLITGLCRPGEVKEFEQYYATVEALFKDLGGPPLRRYGPNGVKPAATQQGPQKKKAGKKRRRDKSSSLSDYSSELEVEEDETPKKKSAKSPKKTSSPNRLAVSTSPFGSEGSVSMQQQIQQQWSPISLGFKNGLPSMLDSPIQFPQLQNQSQNNISLKSPASYSVQVQPSPERNEFEHQQRVLFRQQQVQLQYQSKPQASMRQEENIFIRQTQQTSVQELWRSESRRLLQQQQQQQKQPVYFRQNQQQQQNRQYIADPIFYREPAPQLQINKPPPPLSIQPNPLTQPIPQKTVISNNEVFNAHYNMALSGPSTTSNIQQSGTSGVSTSREVTQLIHQEQQFMTRENKYHPIFQIEQVLQQRLASPPPCPCGGLGVRRPHDFFKNDRDWTGKPVWLAPLRAVAVVEAADNHGHGGWMGLLVD